VFTAARDIAAGEELTITYTDAEAAVSQRQQLLHWGYGFKCCCARCVEELAEQQG
jgi:SET and MYND domain-containing protein